MAEAFLLKETPHTVGYTYYGKIHLKYKIGNGLLLLDYFKIQNIYKINLAMDVLGFVASKTYLFT